MEIDELVKESINNSVSNIDLPQSKYEEIFENIDVKVKKRESNYMNRILSAFRKVWAAAHVRDVIEAIVVIFIIVAIPVSLRVYKLSNGVGKLPQTTNPEIIIDQGNHEKVTVEEAVKLIGEYRRLNNQSMVTSLPLKEITTDQVFQELGCQVFKDGDFEAYVIRDNKVTHIGMGFGGLGVTSIYTADLNKDGRLELVYTYSWGSGLHRSHIAVMMFGETNKEIVSDFVYMNKDLLLEKKDYYTILVREGKSVVSVTDNLSGEEIGSLSLQKSGDSYKLKLIPREGLPQQVKQNIWEDAGVP